MTLWLLRWLATLTIRITYFLSVILLFCLIEVTTSFESLDKKGQPKKVTSNALKVLNNVSDLRISYKLLHLNEKRALPMDFAKYRLAIQLFKIYNGNEMSDDWMDMNCQQNFNARNLMFLINDFLRIKIGKNVICNRLNVLNNLVNLDWLNLSLISFKLKLKGLLSMK